ncbi:MAG TPA: endonuclease/exonuclease/phosphatase family protein [Longimicrobiales bacterium]|nr:endonuclease/exonuclease/phosphatase family protein [Longimicrobiales bacterium]
MLAVGLLAASIAGFFGREGPAGWALDLLGQVRPQYVVGFVALATILVALRWWKTAALALAGAVVNAVVVLPYLTGASTPVVTGETLTVMSLNVKIRQADPVAVAEYLRTSDVDLVYFFAVVEPWLDALMDAGVPHDLLVSRGGRGGLEIAVLGRSPIVETTVHAWGRDPRSMAAEVVVPFEGGRVRVLGTHPLSPRSPGNAAQRNQQLTRVAEWAAEQTDPVLVVGDLNATPWSHAFRALISDSGLVNSLVGAGLQPSWPAVLGPLGIPIDHALHSPALVTVSRELGPSFGSEHRSVIVTVARAR